MNTWRIVVGDALERLRELDTGSVQTCVTSPPYFGLRDYGTGSWEGGDEGCDHSKPAQAQRYFNGQGFVGERGGAPSTERANVAYKDACGKCGATRTDSQLGLEATPDLYVARLVEVFREVRRVLRDDGTLWLNLGDSYAGGKQGRADHGSGDPTSRLGPARDGLPNGTPMGEIAQRPVPPGYKPKDLLGIPWMVAFALRADGWYLRSDIIWAKPNPMPESVTDRPTKAHEYVFLLSKSPKYFWDADAVREDLSPNTRPMRTDGTAPPIRTAETGQPQQTGLTKAEFDSAGRNKRSVWTVATAPFPGAHFAVFPPKLIEPCVLAGSAEDACGVCGAPWERLVEVERSFESNSGRAAAKSGVVSLRDGVPDRNDVGGDSDVRLGPTVRTTTIGWEPSCTCHFAEEGLATYKPDKTGTSIVLDPFAGAGTTGLVATRLGRSFIGIELNESYAELARDRIRDDAPLMNYLIEAS